MQCSAGTVGSMCSAFASCSQVANVCDSRAVQCCTELKLELLGMRSSASLHHLLEIKYLLSYFNY